MSFKKYASIKNHHDGKTIAYWLQNSPKEATWYATEKVHGCNFSIVAEKVEEKSNFSVKLSYARRGDILTEKDGNFHGYKEVVAKYKELVEDFSAIIFKNTPHTSVQFVCELFGKGIQAPEIPYFKDDTHELILLDVLFDGKDWAHFDGLYDIANKIGMRVVKTVAVGTLEEMLKVNPNDMSSPLAAESGVETYIEGVVLKPKVAIVIGPDRAIIKVVSDRFREDKVTQVTKNLIAKKKETAELSLEQRELVLNKVKGEVDGKSIRIGKRAADLGISPGDEGRIGELIKAVKEDVLADLKQEGLELDEKFVTQLIVPYVKNWLKSV